jgi:hypothetical protein
MELDSQRTASWASRTRDGGRALEMHALELGYRTDAWVQGIGSGLIAALNRSTA